MKNPLLIPDLKERSSARADDPDKKRKAYSELAYAVGHDNAEWLRDKRSFDYVRAYALWGNQLENLWRAAVHHESRKAGDKAKYRFQDACEGNLDLGVKVEQRKPTGSSAPKKIRYGDVVFHPEQGEFLADFEALYEDAWRCPEGHFIPSSELRVVRSTHA